MWRPSQPSSPSRMLTKMKYVRSISVFFPIVLVSVLSGYSPVRGHGVGSVPYEMVWETEVPGMGLSHSSSPVIADIDADGRNEAVFGHRDGILRAYEADGSLKWAAAAVPGVNLEECLPQSTPTAIDSSPAVADIDSDGVFEVVVGVGSAVTGARNQNGSVIAFDGRTGRIEWAFDRSRDIGNVWNSTNDIEDGYCEPTYATPAIGDVDGDGSLDIVFASYDFYIWAIDSTGVPLPGFPINNDDSIWSSPALFDVDDDGDVEIFIGGDSTPKGYLDHLGGVFSAIDYHDGIPEIMWRRFSNEVFYSSPAIADINGDQLYEIVIGSGDNWFIACRQMRDPQCGPDDGTDHSRVWAFDLEDGSDVRGWPVRTGNTVWSSPTIGDVDADGNPEVVIGSDDEHVYAFNGDGSVQWRVRPQFAQLNGGGIVRGSAVIADLDGDNDQDVAIGTARGLALLDGRNGAELESNLFWSNRISFAWAHDTTPAVGTFNGRRVLVFAAHSPMRTQTRFAAYVLPPTTSIDAWPMFRHGATRVGTPSTSKLNTSSESVTRHFTEPLQWMTGSKEKIIDAGSAPCATPQTPATRGETALYMWRAAKSPDAAPHPFGDISDRELDRAVSWMYENGVTTGKRIGTVPVFAPEDRLTRAEIAAFLYRLNGETELQQHPFTDISASWQDEPVAWLYKNNITTGTSPSTFSPNKLVSRGELATFLYRYHDEPPVSVNPTSLDCSSRSTIDTSGVSTSHVAVGRNHVCILRADSTIRCWGSDEFSQLNSPSGRFKALSASEFYTCGLRINGSIKCWGDNAHSQLLAPSGTFSEISTGPEHACGLRSNGKVICWGTDEHGRTRAPNGEFVSISVGRFHSCGVRVENTIRCWGFQSMRPEGEFTSVSVGDRYACGLRMDRSILCWGFLDDHGQQAAPPGQFESISAGNWYSCGVRIDGTVECWGHNSHGQANALDGRFKSVVTSTFYTCGVTVSSTVLCWGDLG